MALFVLDFIRRISMKTVIFKFYLIVDMGAGGKQSKTVLKRLLAKCIKI